MDSTSVRRGDRLNDSPKTSISSSTIEKMLDAARRLRSEVINIEESKNSTTQVLKSDFSEFITTSAIDLAAAKAAELYKVQNSTVFAAATAAANDSVPTTSGTVDQKNSSTELLEARKPSIWDTTKLIRMAPVLEFGNELWYSKENFTFATLPQYVQEDWKKISAFESFAEIESALKQTIGNPLTNFLFDWFTKEFMKIYYSNPTTFDNTFLLIALKAEILSLLTRLDKEGADSYWDLFSLQGSPTDGATLFYVLFKSSYDSSGKKLFPSSSEMPIPVLNFNDLTALGEYVVPEKKSAENISAVQPPSIAITSADKMLPEVSTVNATDAQMEILDILKSVISNNTTDRELISNLSKLFDVSVMDMGSTAEVLISEYFDEDSRQTGMTVSKAGAAQFQRDVLRDCLVVSNVKMSQGAVVFEGSISSGCKKEDLAKKIEEKFLQSGLDNSFKYIIINNEKLLSAENGISEL
eukprot:gene28702-37937_t